MYLHFEIVPKLARFTVMVDPRVIIIILEAIKTFIDKKNIDNLRYVRALRN